MSTRNRVKESTTSTSTASISLSGASAGYRPVASAYSVGETNVEFMVGPDSLGAWLIGEYTIAAGTLTRTAIVDSSAAGADVTLAAGSKDVFATMSASRLNSMLRTRDLSFAAAVPLTQPGDTYMAQHTVAGALAFTVSGMPVKNAYVYVRLLANGVNVPTFSGMLERGGSAGYDNRNGIINVIEFFNDGYDTWYAISQAVGAVAVDNIAPTVVSAVVENATPTRVTITFSEVIDQTANPPTGAFSIPGHPISATSISGATVRADTSAAIAGGENLSITYAPTGTNNIKDPSGNQAVGFTQAITNNVAVADTSVPNPTSVTASSSGPTTATGSATVGEANGTLYHLYSTGSTATAAAVKAGSSQAISSTGAKAVNGTGLTASTAHYLHVLHRDAAGNDSAVVTSAQFTTGASATVPAAPTIGTAVPGAGYVDVAFTPGSDGGAAFIDHTATLSSGETATGTSSPIRVSTTTTTARTANVKSRNSEGTGPASAESNSVSPSAPPDYPRFVSRIGLTESGTGPYSYTGTGGTGGTGGNFTNQQATLNKSLGAAGVDGSFSMKYETLTGAGFQFGLSSTATYTGTIAVYMTVTGGVYTVNATGSPTNAGANMAPAEGDILRIRRAGTAVYAEVARAGTPTTFVLIASWANINAVNKCFNLVVTGAAKFTPVDAVGLVASP